ncbi:hypothetical protein D3C73_1559180 [compost metagenome]
MSIVVSLDVSAVGAVSLMVNEVAFSVSLELLALASGELGPDVQPESRRTTEIIALTIHLSRY